MKGITGFIAVLGIEIRRRLRTIWGTVRVMGLIIAGIFISLFFLWVLYSLVLFLWRLGHWGLFFVFFFAGFFILFFGFFGKAKEAESWGENVFREDFKKKWRFKIFGRTMEIGGCEIKSWKESWTVFFIALLAAVCAGVFLYYSLRVFFALSFLVIAVVILIFAFWARAKYQWCLYIKATKELCKTKYYYGEDSQEFRNCIDKQAEICRSPGFRGDIGQHYFKRQITHANLPPEPIKVVKGSLRACVDVNYERWCEEFVDKIRIEKKLLRKQSK